jgi:hypothetical protein
LRWKTRIGPRTQGDNLHRPALWKYTLLALATGLLLAGCMSSSEKPEQMAQDFSASLAAGHSLGQTFTAQYDGLQGVWVYLANPAATDVGEITLHLRASPQDTNDLRRSVLPVRQVTRPAFYRFSFAPLESANQTDYYALLENHAAGTLQLGASQEANYLNGALYRDGAAQEAQLTFGLSYDTPALYTGLVKEFFGWIGWLLIGAWLFVVPGWALLAWLWPQWDHLDWIEKLGLSSGVSLAVYPVVFLWTGLIGLRLGALYAWLPPLCGSVAIAWRLKTTGVLKTFRVSEIGVNNVTLLLLLELIFAVRLWVVRGLALPMWGDSYQHTVMAQLLVDHGGLFDSWQPYAEMTTFTYHFGFHTLAAVFHWISAMDMPQSILYTGQMLNGLAVVVLVPLALRIQRSRWTALAALLLAGLLLPMPMAYSNWGRYTQLAGLTILPVAAYLGWSALEERLPWRGFTLVWLALGGLALTHYRVMVFAVLFYPAFLLLNLRRLPMRAQLMRIMWIAAGAALICLPWFIHTFAGELVKNFSTQMTTLPSQLSEAGQLYNSVGDLSRYLHPLAWLASIGCIGWGMWRRDRGIALVAVWWFLITLAANPQWLGLPGSGVLTNFAVLIAVYIPAALVIGPACAWMVEKAKRHPLSLRKPEKHPARRVWAIISATGGVSKTAAPLPENLSSPAPLPLAGKKQRWLEVGLALLVLLAGAWGAMQRRLDIQIAEHGLVTPADLRAAHWIEANLPPESLLLVNSFFAYGGSAVVGSDGGWWLPLLAHRQTTLPPLPYASEEGPRPDYREWVNALTAAIEAKGIDDPGVIKLLQDRGVTHVYLGQQQGMVNATQPLLEPAELLASSNFQPVYHEDRVWIFEIKP